MPGDDGRIAEMTRAGLAAAARVAREQGLPGDDPELLSSRGNVPVHLRPAPVVARAATLTAWTRNDPFRWLACEVAVAGVPGAARSSCGHPGPSLTTSPGRRWSCTGTPTRATCCRPTARPGPGWLWIDLEETCRGPGAFDLAALADHQGADARATLARTRR